MLKKLKNILKNKKNTRCTAVIVAAGQASRMAGTDKITLELEGQPVIQRTVALFQASPLVDEIVVVTGAEKVGWLRSLCKAKGYTKVAAVTEGGETRVHSVMRGLDAVTEKSGLVAIHDGARPLVTPEIIDDTVRRAMQYHAAAPAIPVKDTIKIAHERIVAETPDRATLFAVQTPQVFDYDLLRGALQKALDTGAAITDDCSAVEALGMSVYLTEGSEENIKITTPLDVILAEAILRRRAQQCE